MECRNVDAGILRITVTVILFASVAEQMSIKIVFEKGRGQRAQPIIDIRLVFPIAHNVLAQDYNEKGDKIL